VVSRAANSAEVDCAANAVVEVAVVCGHDTTSCYFAYIFVTPRTCRNAVENCAAGNPVAVNTTQSYIYVVSYLSDGLLDDIY